MTIINPTVSREALRGSLLQLCANVGRRSHAWLLSAWMVVARGRFRGAAAMLVGVLLVAVSWHGAHSAYGVTWRMPCLSNDTWLLLTGSMGTSFVVLSTALWVHICDQRSSIERLAAVIERHSRDGLPDSLPESGAHEVVRLTRAINAAQQRNAERVAELLDVLAAYAHDLRTPLTRMTLRCELLDDSAVRTAMERDLAEMGELVDGSMACARMQCSATEPLRHVDADGLLGTLVDNYRDAGRPIELEGRVGRPVLTCPHALRRVLANLIDNALRYGSDVRLCVRVEARKLVLAVVDSGPGIVPAEMEAVFAPWYRAPQTAARAPGSGLGLAIARRLTLAMRGELQLENRRSGGLEARVTLPLSVG